MNSPIYYFKKQLKQDKEEINFFLDLCGNYEDKDKCCYNLPLPDAIYEEHKNLDPENYYVGNIGFYERELEYYTFVAEQYEKNDFIVNEDHFYNTIKDDDDIIRYYISPDHKEMAKEICEFLERRIYLLKKENS